MNENEQYIYSSPRKYNFKMPDKYLVVIELYYYTERTYLIHWTNKI